MAMHCTMSKVERCIHSALISCCPRVCTLHSVKTNYPKLGMFFLVSCLSSKAIAFLCKGVQFWSHEHVCPIQVFNSLSIFPSFKYLTIVSFAIVQQISSMIIIEYIEKSQIY